MLSSEVKGGGCQTSVPGFVAQQNLHLPVLLQRLQQDVALFVEEEQERHGDVIGAASVAGHLKQRSRVTAAALVVIWVRREHTLVMNQ